MRGGPPNETLQLIGVPSTGVSAEIVVNKQFCGEPPESQVQVMVTFVLYQPEQSSGPGEQCRSRRTCGKRGFRADAERQQERKQDHAQPQIHAGLPLSCRRAAKSTTAPPIATRSRPKPAEREQVAVDRVTGGEATNAASGTR